MSATGVIDRGVRLGGEQRDYNHVSDPQYKKLRALADEAYKKRNQLSQQSQAAFKQGDKARAHELSEQAKKQVEIADNYNFQAAEYVFRENNADSDGNEIDLHGLYVKEALYILKRRMTAGVQRGEKTLEVIVGKGIHSANGVAKLKPAVEELCEEAGFDAHIDPKNTGVLIVNLSGETVPESWQNLPAPQAAYHSQQQPVYQQQHGSASQYYGGQPGYNNNNNNYHQQQQQHQQGQNFSLGGNSGLLLKIFCMCFKQLTK
ncbi:CYFA0S26e00738g1_1 [Cyberlindnera fabianii]|uniref:CYFA0S26e00738g1_1 n=1 Tax=Cyberlindnera fabianii TaxID=36022 RepID=A0A061BIN3_CYBFA|nr:NEDD4-binding protein 2 [Cyberlindnera fabianii]CDR46846.1 CYFA0S26e00738g1_1 [Cyberlindnera fabianii]